MAAKFKTLPFKTTRRALNKILNELNSGEIDIDKMRLFCLNTLQNQFKFLSEQIDNAASFRGNSRIQELDKSLTTKFNDALTIIDRIIALDNSITMLIETCDTSVKDSRKHRVSAVHMIEYFAEYLTSILYSHFNDIVNEFEEMESLAFEGVDEDEEEEEFEEENDEE